MVPIVRDGADGERELVMARWGMPGAAVWRRSITNILNVGSLRWPWLGKQNRCIVPATFILRVRRYQARKDAEMVRAQPRSAIVRFRWSMETVARRARAKERAS